MKNKLSVTVQGPKEALTNLLNWIIHEPAVDLVSLATGENTEVDARPRDYQVSFEADVPEPKVEHTAPPPPPPPPAPESEPKQDPPPAPNIEVRDPKVQAVYDISDKLDKRGLRLFPGKFSLRRETGSQGEVLWIAGQRFGSVQTRTYHSWKHEPKARFAVWKGRIILDPERTFHAQGRSVEKAMDSEAKLGTIDSAVRRCIGQFNCKRPKNVVNRYKKFASA